MADKKRNLSESQLHIMLFLGLVVVAFIVAGLLFWKFSKEKDINDFQSCKDAGGAILESYPEQCLINGRTYTNETQKVDGSSYVGLSEQDALAKAKQGNTPARVVERDGEMLPVTMDFVFGRHNLHVKDGKVYRVEIEGHASDLPL